MKSDIFDLYTHKPSCIYWLLHCSGCGLFSKFLTTHRLFSVPCKHLFRRNFLSVKWENYLCSGIVESSDKFESKEEKKYLHKDYILEISINFLQIFRDLSISFDAIITEEPFGNTFVFIDDIYERFVELIC